MIKILHLYPKLMNLYGEYGNISVLNKHLIDQGLKVKIDAIEIGEDYDPNEYDFMYMGSGTDSHLLFALEDIIKHSKDINDYIKKGKTLLFTGNAMELLGKTIDDKKALGIFDFESKYQDKRYTGDVIVFNEKLGKIVGFINRSSLIFSSSRNHLFKYEFKDQNLIDNDYEGFRTNNAYATHIIGPILAKNPKFLNEIICSIIPSDFELKEIKYPYEEESYNVTLKELSNRR